MSATLPQKIFEQVCTEPLQRPQAMSGMKDIATVEGKITWVLAGDLKLSRKRKIELKKFLNLMQQFWYSRFLAFLESDERSIGISYEIRCSRVLFRLLLTESKVSKTSIKATVCFLSYVKSSLEPISKWQNILLSWDWCNFFNEAR